MVNQWETVEKWDQKWLEEKENKQQEKSHLQDEETQKEDWEMWKNKKVEERLGRWDVK